LLVLEQHVVHGPEPPLRAGTFGRLGCALRARVHVCDWLERAILMPDNAFFLSLWTRAGSPAGPRKIEGS
jgi:hypothetical protein